MLASQVPLSCLALWRFIIHGWLHGSASDHVVMWKASERPFGVFLCLASFRQSNVSARFISTFDYLLGWSQYYQLKLNQRYRVTWYTGRKKKQPLFDSKWRLTWRTVFFLLSPGALVCTIRSGLHSHLFSQMKRNVVSHRVKEPTDSLKSYQRLPFSGYLFFLLWSQ